MPSITPSSSHAELRMLAISASSDVSAIKRPEDVENKSLEKIGNINKMRQMAQVSLDNEKKIQVHQLERSATKAKIDKLNNPELKTDENLDLLTSTHNTCEKQLADVTAEKDAKSSKLTGLLEQIHDIRMKQKERQESLAVRRKMFATLFVKSRKT